LDSASSTRESDRTGAESNVDSMAAERLEFARACCAGNLAWSSWPTLVGLLVRAGSQLERTYCRI